MSRPPRWCAFTLMFVAVSVAAQQQPSAPSTTSQPQDQQVGKEPTSDQQIEKEKELQKKEQSSRFLGVVPMFGVTHQNALPLTPGQKFHLFAKSAVDPFVWVAAGFQAGLSQATDGFHDYGQGAEGYGKRYGAAMADATSSNFFSNFFYPVLLKQDPRYWRLGQGTTGHRIAGALEQVVVGHTDSRKTTFNFPNVLGAFTTGGISNLYYPESDRGFGLTMSRSAISLAYGGAGNILSEFWPDIQQKISRKKKKQAAAPSNP